MGCVTANPDSPLPGPSDSAAGTPAEPPAGVRPAQDNTIEQSLDHQAWLREVLPGPFMARCDQAAERDSEVHADCFAIIVNTQLPMERLRTVGVPEQPSLLTMNAEELRAFQEQTEALRQVRELAATSSSLEQAAIRSSTNYSGAFTPLDNKKTGKLTNAMTCKSAKLEHS